MIPFIIAAISADGFIARDAHHPAFWTSKEDKKRFVELTKRAGVVVMGSTTYKTLPRPLAERVNIVYTRSKQFEGAETTQLDPQALVDSLEARGFKELAICGGAEIYNMFLQAKAVRKIYLTIEPIIFGKGITLFKDDVNYKLELMNLSKTETGTVMLEYNVHYSS
ncbi:MAG: dihydrofolate reductase [Candidatus Pacebacteria bacterium]|nr:dihydrofolate reductase [Candidatus Paceibacterota bacterium]